MLTYFACFSSKPKPSKRAKANKPVADPSADEPVIDPSTAVPPEGTPAAPVDEPALETPAAEDVQDPPSPARVNSPQVNPASPDPAHVDVTPPNVPTSPDVVVTGTAYAAPAEPTVLAKHTAKAEKIAQEKGKWSTDMSSLSIMSAQDIYSGYLNRLHSSRDYEASLVNLMREKYEVSFLF